MLLTIGTDAPEPVAAINIGTLVGDDHGDLTQSDGNLWLNIDGEYIGSIWFKRDELGFIHAILGEASEADGDWVPTADIMFAPEVKQ